MLRNPRRAFLALFVAVAALTAARASAETPSPPGAEVYFINLKDGEPAVVAGEVSRTDTRSMSGIPGLGFVPLLNQAMVNNTKESDSDELMIILTPHVLANLHPTTPEIWISEK